MARKNSKLFEEQENARKNIFEKVNNFLSLHQIILDEFAQKCLNDFKIYSDTDVIIFDNCISLYSYKAPWHTSLSIYKDGKATLSIGNQ